MADMGIWRYAKRLVPSIPAGDRITLGEGDTQLVSGKQLSPNGCSLFFKREDLNPTGSHKARSLVFQISYLHSRSMKCAVISSSGNAAIAAAAYAKLAGIELIVLLSPKTSPAKLNEIAKFPVTIVLSDHAARLCNYLARVHRYANLRPSVDDYSIQGFTTLAYELHDQIKLICAHNPKTAKIDHIFTYVTSGSSLLGLYQGFKMLQDSGDSASIPVLHAVQSGGVVSIAEHFDQRPLDAPKTNLALGETRRKHEVIEAIIATGGSGWIISQEEIDQAASELGAHGLSTSDEGCASFSAVKTAVHELHLRGTIVCILTGHRYEDSTLSAEAGSWPRIETTEELDVLLAQISR
jgi:threonine synthase